MVNSQDPLVSIIIPAYNRADLIGETLESFLAQTYKNWECIVVDDGSTDNTKEVVQKYVEKDSRIKLFDRPPAHNSGGNGARNYGFKVSKGDYVQWFDSDDLIIPISLERFIHNFDDRYDLIVAEAKFFEKNIDDSEILFPNIKNSHPVSLSELITLKQRWAIGGCLWRSSSLPKELFNEELKRSQEWEFHIRMILQGKRIFVLDNFIAVHVRIHPQSMSVIINPKNEFENVKARRIMFNLLDRIQMKKDKKKIAQGFLVEHYAQQTKLFLNYSSYKYLFNTLHYFLIDCIKSRHYFFLFKVIFIAMPIKIFTGRDYRYFKI